MALNHYVRKEQDGELRYIGAHGRRPREAYGPAIPQDMIPFARFLKAEEVVDELGNVRVTFTVDHVKRNQKEQAEGAKQRAQEIREAKLAQRDARVRAAHDQIDNMNMIQLKQVVKDLILKVEGLADKSEL